MLYNFSQAENYLNSHVRQGKRQIFQGAKGLEKMRYFLSLLGSPQNELKIIHIAGTAGKGSTCYLISRILAAHGFKVGLHLSPHLTDVRERFQIDNKIISKKEFLLYLNGIILIIDKVERSQYGDLSFFEVLVGLAFYIFLQKKVDYAVMETGLGGLYDATNVSDREDKISVLTRIGFDHMEILGKTLKEIAYQKAMIINEKSQAVALDQSGEVKKTVEEVAKIKKAKINFVPPLSFRPSDRRERVEKSLKDSSTSLGMTDVPYQQENIALALKTVEIVSRRDGFKVDQKKVGAVLKTARFIGRFDIKKINSKTVIFDGAHNSPKMKAFTDALKDKYKKEKFHFLIAFKKGKDYGSMLQYVVPIASKITITGFLVDNQDLIHFSEEPEAVGRKLKKIKFINYEIIKHSKKAFENVLKKTDKKVVVTGSLYLLGEIYKILKS